MSWKRSSSLYHLNSPHPFKISRSKIDLFLECPRCFYLDRRLGISRPSLPGFSLNSAVDILLKKEFDLLRKVRQPHELMKKYRLHAIPFQHPDLEVWRNPFRGKEYRHEGTNFIITGAVDDIWTGPHEELFIVDYKSTSTEKAISLEDQYKQMYKKQLEVYQWIFRRSGFSVSNLGYFVFANAGKNRPSFDGKLEFELSIIPYRGDDSWVEPTIYAIKECLDSEKLPAPSRTCEYCSWREAIEQFSK